jgi:LPXTG-motif cell wall-anchored protein
MLRKLVAVTGTVFVAVGLATASAVASEVPEVSVANRGHGAKPPYGSTPPDVPSPDSPYGPSPDSPGLPPDSGPGGPPADSGPPPPAMPPAAPPPDVPVESPPPAPPAPPEEVRPVEKVRPPAGFSDEAPTRLPQTGSAARPLTATGGASLLGAGLAVIAGARQKRRTVTRPGPRR